MSSRWNSFLASLEGAPPLRYVYGIRHPVRRGTACPVHSHRAIEIVYHAAGAGRVRLPGDRAVPFPEGGLVVHAPEEPHDQVMDEAGEDICIQLAVPDPKALTQAGTFCLERLPQNAALSEIEFLGRGFAQPDRVTQSILDLRATGLLMALLHEAALAPKDGTSSRQGEEAYVRRAEKHLREHYQTISSIRSVAEHAGVGYDHLRHLFKTCRGKSLIRALNEIRVDRAKTHLVHSQLPMKQIATLCGFRDEYYFSAVFRNFTGASPLAYRRRHLTAS